MEITPSQDIEKISSISFSIMTEYFPGRSILTPEQAEYLWLRTASPKRIAERIEAGQQFFLLGEEDDLSRGVLGLQGVSKEGVYRITLLYIPKEHRGQGYGTRALAFVEDVARMNRAQSLCLFVADRNQAARDFYEHRGFKVGAFGLPFAMGNGLTLSDTLMIKVL